MTIARTATPPVMTQGKSNKARVGLVLLVLFGLALLHPLTIKPLLLTFQAQSWAATPCTILRGEVLSQNSRLGGIEYRVHIAYEYRVAGTLYQSDRYDFVGGTPGGYKRKVAIVDAYRQMAHPVCYVNPKNPADAVLTRGFNPKLLIVFFPLLLILVGVGGAFGMLSDKRREVVSRSVLRLTDKGSIILEPSRWPPVQLVGTILIALVWNTIALAFAVVMFRGFRDALTDWYLVVFLLPFSLLGLVIIASVVYQFLALSNPRPTLELSAPTVPLGGTAHLWWSVVGRIDRIQEFTVTLRGTEEVAYLDSPPPEGRKRARDSSTFYEAVLYRTSNPGDITAGSVAFTIPRETMYSFATLHSRIFWNLDIEGRIAKWPALKESFKITVIPAPTG